MYCALRKKENLKELKAGGAAALFDKFREDVANGRVALLGLTEDVHREAERLGQRLAKSKAPLLLRSLDLIHIASAVVGKSVEIGATDVRLRDVASEIGLRVLPTR